MDRRFGSWAGDVEAGERARIRRWGLGRLAMGLGVGRRNRSAMRELAGELERKKIEEERRKKKEEKPKREREREKQIFI